MEAIVLVIHLIVAFCLVLVVLLQRSEGGGLGIGGSGGLGNIAGQRSTADFMTRLTTILGIIFVATSLLLAILATQKTDSTNKSILDIKASEASEIMDMLDDDTIGTSDIKNLASDEPEIGMGDGVIDVPMAPSTGMPKAPSKKTEKPSAPVSK